MGAYTADWWIVNYGVNKWAHLNTTIVDSRGDWFAPVLIKTGTEFVDGEERNGGTIMVAMHLDAIQPPTPVDSWSSVKVAGDMETPDPTTLYSWSHTRIPGGSYEYNGFMFWGPSHGNDIQGFYGECYEYDTVQDMLDAIDNGEITPIRKTIYFDVYINGTDQPNIWVNWTAPEELGVATLTPKVWIAVDNNLPLHQQDIRFDTDLDLYVPNTNAWQVDSAGSFSYGGSFESSYLSIVQNFEQYLNAANKIIAWGIDGIPSYVRLFLQMNYDEYIGELQQVTIQKDGTPANLPIAESGTSGNIYNTVVRFHTGEPDYVMPDDPDGYPGNSNFDDDGPGRYDPDDIPDPTDFTDPVGFDGNAVLTKTYAVSEATLRNIGQKLWSQSYFNVLKIQNNPIENIVAVKHYPFAHSTGTTENIKVGDIDFGISGLNVPSVKHISIGSYTYTGYYNNFLDLAPYTKTKINLPYIGLIELDPADIYGSKLSVDYYIDLVTGQCMAKLELDATNQKGIPYMTLFGQIGVDIPLTSSDRVQTELRAASAAVTAMGGNVGQIISGNVGGGMISGLSDALNIAGADYTTQRTSSQSPACGSFACQDVFLLIERPTSYRTGQTETGRMESEGYKHLHGLPYHKYKTLNTFAAGSFVQVDRRTDISFGMTAEENEMLEQLLTTGVYI